MAIRWPGLASFRRRILFRSVFFLLALVTVAMAINVLHEEKRLSYQAYREGFKKTQEQVATKLRHPAGQLALLNPPRKNVNITPLHPVVLPYSGIDFDDRNKVQQAIEMAGCLVQYPSYGSVCVAVGHSAWMGGFIYVAGSFASGELIAHRRGEPDVEQSHRVRLAVNMRDQTYRWIAPFETEIQLTKLATPSLDKTLAVSQKPVLAPSSTGSTDNLRAGRLTGFMDTGRKITGRPVQDFRGWIWQTNNCITHTTEDLPQNDCLKRSFFSIRLPVPMFQDGLFQKNAAVVWPPDDLEQIQVRVEALPPGSDVALLDSNASDATPPFSLTDLTPLLLPGETLRIRKVDNIKNATVILTGTDKDSSLSSKWLTQLIQQLPVDGYDTPLETVDNISTPLGTYEAVLTGDVRSLNKNLNIVAAQLTWFAGAMLLAIGLAWLLIEIGIIRRILLLTQRAASVSKDVHGAQGVSDLNLSDLSGADELGVLASCLADLLQRVREHTQRESIRAEQEKNMWHAVGHEIMAPLQSLIALHGPDDDVSSRYIYRMQQAIRVLYGNASPSEAFESTTLQVKPIDLMEFLQHVASNASCVGIDNVQFTAEPGIESTMVRADEYSLEDVVTHILHNANRYRIPSTDITIHLSATDTIARITIHNQGEAIPDSLIDKIFEYGVSDPNAVSTNANLGQGLFVAKTYMAKMGGTITAHNVTGGVSFALELQRVLS